MTGLSEELAIEFVLAVAMEAGRLVKSDASEHVQALRTLVECYIADPRDPLCVDWSFLKARLFRKKAEWIAEDKRRHLRALEALKATGYGQVSRLLTSPRPRRPSRKMRLRMTTFPRNRLIQRTEIKVSWSALSRRSSGEEYSETWPPATSVE